MSHESCTLLLANQNRVILLRMLLGLKRTELTLCFPCSSEVEEVTIDPNSQWEPVVVKQEPKDEDCHMPATKKFRPPPESLPLPPHTSTSNSSAGSNSSSHYSPYQTQLSNPGIGVPTPPVRTPPEMRSSTPGATPNQDGPQSTPGGSGTPNSTTTNKPGKLMCITYHMLHILFMFLLSLRNKITARTVICTVMTSFINGGNFNILLSTFILALLSLFSITCSFESLTQKRG